MKLGLPNPAAILANHFGKMPEDKVTIKNNIEKVAIVVAVVGLAAIAAGVGLFFVATLPFHWPASLILGGAIAGLLGTYTAVGSEKATLGGPRFEDLRPWHTKLAEWLGFPTKPTPDY